MAPGDLPDPAFGLGSGVLISQALGPLRVASVASGPPAQMAISPTEPTVATTRGSQGRRLGQLTIRRMSTGGITQAVEMVRSGCSRPKKAVAGGGPRLSRCRHRSSYGEAAGESARCVAYIAARSPVVRGWMEQPGRIPERCTDSIGDTGGHCLTLNAAAAIDRRTRPCDAGRARHDKSGDNGHPG